ncbi:MAG: hypothetical protein ABI430_01365 [Candidatus Taylorbacteria bacterium]
MAEDKENAGFEKIQGLDALEAKFKDKKPPEEKKEASLAQKKDIGKVDEKILKRLAEISKKVGDPRKTVIENTDALFEKRAKIAVESGDEGLIKASNELHEIFKKSVIEDSAIPVEGKKETTLSDSLRLLGEKVSKATPKIGTEEKKGGEAPLVTHLADESFGAPKKPDAPLLKNDAESGDEKKEKKERKGKNQTRFKGEEGEEGEGEKKKGGKKRGKIAGGLPPETTAKAEPPPKKEEIPPNPIGASESKPANVEPARTESSKPVRNFEDLYERLEKEPSIVFNNVELAGSVAVERIKDKLEEVKSTTSPVYRYSAFDAFIKLFSDRNVKGYLRRLFVESDQEVGNLAEVNKNFQEIKSIPGVADSKEKKENIDDYVHKTMERAARIIEENPTLYSMLEEAYMKAKYLTPLELSVKKPEPIAPLSNPEDTAPVVPEVTPPVILKPPGEEGVAEQKPPEEKLPQKSPEELAQEEQLILELGLAPKPPASPSEEKLPAQPEALTSESSNSTAKREVSSADAGIPFMITRDMQERLIGMGKTQSEIDSLKPEEAWRILEGKGEPKNDAEALKPADEEIPSAGEALLMTEPPEEPKPVEKPVEPVVSKAEEPLKTEPVPKAEPPKTEPTREPEAVMRGATLSRVTNAEILAMSIRQMQNYDAKFPLFLAQYPESEEWIENDDADKIRSVFEVYTKKEKVISGLKSEFQGFFENVSGKFTPEELEAIQGEIDAKSINSPEEIIRLADILDTIKKNQAEIKANEAAIIQLVGNKSVDDLAAKIGLLQGEKESLTKKKGEFKYVGFKKFLREWIPGFGGKFQNEVSSHDETVAKLKTVSDNITASLAALAKGENFAKIRTEFENQTKQIRISLLESLDSWKRISEISIEKAQSQLAELMSPGMDPDKAQEKFDELKRMEDEEGVDFLEGLNEDEMQKRNDDAVDGKVSGEITKALKNFSFGANSVEELQKALKSHLERNKAGSRKGDQARKAVRDLLVKVGKDLPGTLEGKAKRGFIITILKGLPE